MRQYIFLILLALSVEDTESFIAPKLSFSKRFPLSVSRVQVEKTEEDNVLLKTANPRNLRSGEYDFSYWSKAFKSQENEFNYFLDEKDIDGEIPPNLSGTLFRGIHLYILYVHLYIIRMHIYYMYYI